MPPLLTKNRIVLLGVGHTNAHVLKMWKMNRLDNCELICISNYPVATYSGMLPGVLAGQYQPSDMEIDLVRLCQSANARLIIDDVVGIDHQRNQLRFANRSPLSFDYLSIGIGSRPSFKNVKIVSSETLVAVKPMQTFLARLLGQLNSPHPLGKNENSMHPRQIAVVGGGVGSIELAFCLNARLKSMPLSHYQIILITGSSRIGNQLLAATQGKLEKALREQQIEVVTNSRVSEIHADRLSFTNGQTRAADAIVWATEAAPPPMLAQLGLELDQAGFIAIGPTLQTTQHPFVFAVGDTATLVDSPTPKAGVYAVRQGPILWQNLKHALNHQPLINFDPQAGFLKLINTGDGQGIGEYRGFSFYSRWAWKLKDRIDSKFMAMYQNYEIPAMQPQVGMNSDEMRCLGCGGKIGAQILSDVIGQLKLPHHPDVILGLDQPDDAAIIRTYDNQVTVTTDFFASPFDDPYLVGRIATLNSASDCFVMGSQPTAALAMVQVPAGHPKSQTRLLQELMAGSLEEISRMGAALVGGHSIEGSPLTIGFTFLGRQITTPKTKGGLKEGDQLILSKPLGTGILLAALMRAALPGNSFPSLLRTMLQSNQIALTLIQGEHVTTLTDVTGFGLAGHLGEMLTASQLSAQLHLDWIPRLPAADQLVQAGFESTLASANRNLAGLELAGRESHEPAAAILFDPQTSGGLLLGVTSARVSQTLRILQDAGFDQAAVIGEVTPLVSSRPKLLLC